MIDVLRIAHLRIAPQEGNHEVGNCEGNPHDDGYIISFLSIFSNTLSKLWVMLWNEYIVTTTIISMQAINLRPQKCANTEYLKKLTSDIFVLIVYSRNKMQGKTIQ